MEIKEVLEKLNAQYSSSKHMVLKENGVEYAFTVSELRPFFLLTASVPMTFTSDEEKAKITAYLDANNNLLNQDINDTLDIGLYSLDKHDDTYYLNLRTSIWVDNRVTVPKMQELFRQMQARLVCTLSQISYNASKQA